MPDSRDILIAAYERFGSDLFRYLAVLAGSRDAAEEIMQEVFVRLTRVAGRDAPALANKSFVFTVARNEAFRMLAARWRRMAVSNERLLELSDPKQGSEVERAAVQEALQRLPEAQREVVHLKVYMNMTFDEIADLTRVPPDTAASRYRYALAKLRETLGDGEMRK